MQVLGSTEALDKALEPSSDLLLAQRKGHPTLFSSSTSSAYWRFIRKGIAPAFIQKNIKCVALRTSAFTFVCLCAPACTSLHSPQPASHQAAAAGGRSGMSER